MMTAALGVVTGTMALDLLIPSNIIVVKIINFADGTPNLQFRERFRDVEE